MSEIISKEINFINQGKENVELTNIVKIKSFHFFYKNKFAVLTTNRILLFNDKESYLRKSACKVKIFYIIKIYFSFLLLI
jgi:hypothetical protein